MLTITVGLACLTYCGRDMTKELEWISSRMCYYLYYILVHQLIIIFVFIFYNLYPRRQVSSCFVHLSCLLSEIIK